MDSPMRSSPFMGRWGDDVEGLSEGGHLRLVLIAAFGLTATAPSPLVKPMARLWLARCARLGDLSSQGDVAWIGLLIRGSQG